MSQSFGYYMSDPLSRSIRPLLHSVSQSDVCHLWKRPLKKCSQKLGGLSWHPVLVAGFLKRQCYRKKRYVCNVSVVAWFTDRGLGDEEERLLANCLHVGRWLHDGLNASLRQAHLGSCNWRLDLKCLVVSGFVGVTCEQSSHRTMHHIWSPSPFSHLMNEGI